MLRERRSAGPGGHDARTVEGIQDPDLEPFEIRGGDQLVEDVDAEGGREGDDGALGDARDTGEVLVDHAEHVSTPPHDGRRRPFDDDTAGPQDDGFI
ncbi:MAG: hypothetical protein JWP75_3121 [Frondihabitans sp.]|nr:hypothetical protein [Frondihabitans sp.]